MGADLLLPVSDNTIKHVAHLVRSLYVANTKRKVLTEHNNKMII